MARPQTSNELPESFTANYNGGAYNGLMQVSQTNSKAVFVVNENTAPFTADNVTVKGGDDSRYVGN